MVDIKRRVFMGAGQQVDDGIGNPAVFIAPHQIELAAALFNGDEASVVGDLR